ncbi:MAG TPA: hypothetical protein VF787_18470 [Thermoanaerobaculia bacterium]
MRRTLLVLLCLVSSAAFARGNADIIVTSFTADQTTIAAGSPLTLTIRVKNIGTEAAVNYNFNLSNSYSNRMAVIAATASAGFRCSPIFTNCFSESVPVGAEGVMTMVVATPPAVRVEPLRIEMFGSALNESVFQNNHAELNVTVTAPSRTADLAVAFQPMTSPVPKNTPVEMNYAIRNNGPNDVADVRVVLYLQSDPATTQIDGAGWTCTGQDFYSATCSRNGLAAGTNAPLRIRAVTPNAPGGLGNSAMVFSVQPHIDPNLINDFGGGGVSVGELSDWSRVLVPITETDTPGRDGSLWRADVTGIRTTQAPLDPSGCGPVEDPCGYPPVGKMFNVRWEDLIYDYEEFGSQYIYQPSAAANTMKLTTRVYDTTKAGQTAGAVIPHADDDDFVAGGFSLIGIPVADEFRTLVRVYEYDATENASVEVTIYPQYADTPVATMQERLRTTRDERVTTALLPLRPGMAAIDLSAALIVAKNNLPGPTYPGNTFRVDVRPVGAQLKLWGFITITNNQTSHVTVVTP